MVVRLRLQRWGCKHRPFYRIVAADARAPRDGKFIEILGTYNPIPCKDGVKEICANSERIKYWMSVGAQPSDRVQWLCAKVDILPPPPTRNTVKYEIPKSLQKKAKT